MLIASQLTRYLSAKPSGLSKPVNEFEAGARENARLPVKQVDGRRN
jgi:hypothetical protein